MAVPEIYLCQSISLAKKIREGIIGSGREEIISYLGKNYKEGISDRIIEVALKLLKYPDISKAAWDYEYRKEIDGNLEKKI